MFNSKRPVGTIHALKAILKKDTDRSERIYSLQTEKNESIQIVFARAKAFSIEQAGAKTLKERHARRNLDKYPLQNIERQSTLFGITMAKSTAAEKINEMPHRISRENLDEDVSLFILLFHYYY